MDNVFNDPRVREIQKMLEARLSGVVPAGKIQFGILRAFKALSASEKSLSFNLGDKSKVIPGVEMLMQDDRVAIVFSQSMGIFQVPTTGAGPTRVELIANGKYLSSLNSGVFTPAEVKSLLPYYNAKLRFDTDQTIRYDAMSSSMHLHVEEQSKDGEVNTTLKHLMLPTYFPVVGGKVNTITATMPTESDIANIGGTAATQNYGVMEFACMYLVGGDADKILSALFGGN